ncbi:uncharacterized protein LOC144170329 [Haemaphysalis longicornis]
MAQSSHGARAAREHAPVGQKAGQPPAHAVCLHPHERHDSSSSAAEGRPGPCAATVRAAGVPDGDGAQPLPTASEEADRPLLQVHLREHHRRLPAGLRRARHDPPPPHRDLLRGTSARVPSAGMVKIIRLPARIPYVLAVFLMAATSGFSRTVPVYDPVAEDVACVPPCVMHVHVTHGINTSASSEAAAICSTLQRFPDKGRPIYNQGMDGVAIVITGFDCKTELRKLLLLYHYMGATVRMKVSFGNATHRVADSISRLTCTGGPSGNLHR